MKVIGHIPYVEPGEKLHPVAENQTASTATTVAGLTKDFNALLEKLKSVGLMEADKTSST